MYGPDQHGFINGAEMDTRIHLVAPGSEDTALCGAEVWYVTRGTQRVDLVTCDECLAHPDALREYRFDGPPSAG
jgi:hypothetical protein